MTGPPGTMRKWPLTLCGCYGYKDHKGNQRWCPDFCCTAMVCSNMMTGRLWTKVYRETPCCCGLGPTGCLICATTLPLSFYSPMGGVLAFCILSNHLRSKVVDEYNVEEEQCCCCGSFNYCINYAHFGCNYPCSLFQVAISLEHWENESKNQTVHHTTNPVIATVISPVNTR